MLDLTHKPPAECRNHGEPPAPRVPNARTKRRVLIADDNPDSAATLAMMLEVFGNEVRVARDGHEAVEIAEAFRPEAILLDIAMPRLNGYDACGRIRLQSHGGGKQPVIMALTGWGQEEDRQRTRAAGFDHHLVKPVDPAALEKLLAAIPVATPG
jgi:CheY-like chemotaxis protein